MTGIEGQNLSRVDLELKCQLLVNEINEVKSEFELFLTRLTQPKIVEQTHDIVSSNQCN